MSDEDEYEYEEVEVEEEEEEEEEEEAEEIEMSQNDDEDKIHGSVSSSIDVNNFVNHANQTKLYYGSSSVLIYPQIDNIRLNLDCRNLDPKHAQIYKIEKPDTTVVLSVQFGPGYIQAKTPPVIRANHQPQTEKLAIAEQLENLARIYVENRWKEMHGTSEAVTPLEKLLQMGYEKKYCLLALDKNADNFQKAAQWLTDNIKRLRKQNSGLLPNSPNVNPNQKSNKSNPFSNFFTKTSSNNNDSTITNYKELIKKGQVQLALAMALYENQGKLDRAVEKIMDSGAAHEGLATLMNGGDISSNKNFILELMTYLIRRMKSCIGNCMICDESVQVSQDVNIEGQPIICTKGTCQFNYQELGVCSKVDVVICPTTISEDIMHNPNVVDLLISMAVAAATSNRRDMIFEPFPPEFLSGITRNYSQLEKILASLPSVEDMTNYCDNEDELIAYLSQFDSSGQAYRLLRWILTIQRPAMLKMPSKKQIAEMNTPHQYMMLSETSPEKSAKFKELRKQYGSYFAFHGSGIENWHSILRKGLINASGTKLMTTGAVYGSGVYLAPNSSTSMGYARTGKAWDKSRFGDSASLTCLAIAEVVKHPEADITPNPYYVIKNADYVATRFFLFYPSSLRNNGDVLAKNLKLSDYI